MRRAAALLAAGALLLVAAGAPDPKTETSHVVKAGETLGGIASRAEVPRVLIIEANGLKAPYAVRAGQKLVIPRRRTHVVKDGETGFSIAMDYGVPWSTIAAANGLKSGEAVKEGQKLAIPTLTKSTASAPTTPTTKPAATPSVDVDDANPPSKFAWPLIPAPAFKEPISTARSPLTPSPFASLRSTL